MPKRVWISCQAATSAKAATKASTRRLTQNLTLERLTALRRSSPRPPPGTLAPVVLLDRPRVE